jgi:hypothetical protein
MILKSNNDGRADVPEDRLLSGLRANFVRAYSGDRARTTSFINVNLAALGGCEWMEAYSLDGQNWHLKRMEWKPGLESQPVIHLHTQKQYPAMNFGEALYHLARYEAAQCALGFIPDPEDRGQVTGTILFRDLAKAEGLPHDADGNFVLPVKGHLVEDGMYHVDAFKVAATGAAVSQKSVLLAGAGIAPEHSLKIITRIDESKPYTLSADDRKTLDRFYHYQGNTITAMKDAVRLKLLENKNHIFGYKSAYEGLMERYQADRPERWLNSKDDDLAIMPAKLMNFLKYQVVMFDFLASRILASLIAQELPATPVHPQRAEKVFQDALGYCRQRVESLGPAMNDKNVLNSETLNTLNVEDEFQKLSAIRQFIKDMAQSVSIDLAAVPVVKLKESALNLLPVQRITGPGPG